MKATLPRQPFLEALTAAASLTGGRTTRPILSCVRIDVSKDALEVSATDGETALKLGFSGLAVKKPGQAVIAADRLLGIVRELDDVEITLEQAFRGNEREIVVPRAQACEPCKGSGSEGNAPLETCATCQGAGQVRTQQGMFRMVRTCPQCHGRGQSIKTPCRSCGGRGQVQKERTLSVKIPAGVEDGTRIRLAGEGDAGVRGGPAGDLYLFLSVSLSMSLSR